MTNKAMPLVSICTACYNHEDYIRDYFESIIAQTYPNIELVIGDDVSTDSSRQIIESYLPRLKERFVNVVYLPNETNLGIVRNCININGHASGKYIKPFASDDVMLPHCIENAVNFMEEHADYAFGYSDCYVVPYDYRHGDSPDGFPHILDPDYIKEGYDLFETMLRRQFITATGMFYKRETFEKYGYDTEIAIEDQDFWLTLARNNEGIGYIPGSQVCYRRSLTSISNYDVGNAEKKFRFAYEATTKMYHKQLAFADEKLQKEIWDMHYWRYLDMAMDYELDAAVREIKKIVKTRKMHLTGHQKAKMFLYNVGLLKLARNVKRFLRERKR